MGNDIGRRVVGEITFAHVRIQHGGFPPMCSSTPQTSIQKNCTPQLEPGGKLSKTEVEKCNNREGNKKKTLH